MIFGTSFVVFRDVNPTYEKYIRPFHSDRWDPISFDTSGPLVATLKDSLFPAPNLHDAGIFDWHNDIGYHYYHCNLKNGDFDDNRTFDLYNSAADPDCQGDPVIGGYSES